MFSYEEFGNAYLPGALKGRVVKVVNLDDRWSAKSEKKEVCFIDAADQQNNNSSQDLKFVHRAHNPTKPPCIIWRLSQWGWMNGIVIDVIVAHKHVWNYMELYYFILSYILLYHIISYHIISYHMLLYYCNILYYFILSYIILYFTIICVLILTSISTSLLHTSLALGYPWSHVGPGKRWKLIW